MPQVYADRPDRHSESFRQPLILSGIAIVGVLLQIRFPFKALKAYPRGGII